MRAGLVRARFECVRWNAVDAVDAVAKADCAPRPQVWCSSFNSLAGHWLSQLRPPSYPVSSLIPVSNPTHSSCSVTAKWAAVDAQHKTSRHWLLVRSRRLPRFQTFHGILCKLQWAVFELGKCPSGGQLALLAGFMTGDCYRVSSLYRIFANLLWTDRPFRTQLIPVNRRSSQH